MKVLYSMQQYVFVAPTNAREHIYYFVCYFASNMILNLQHRFTFLFSAAIAQLFSKNRLKTVECPRSSRGRGSVIVRAPTGVA